MIIEHTTLLNNTDTTELKASSSIKYSPTTMLLRSEVQFSFYCTEAEDAAESWRIHEGKCLHTVFIRRPNENEKIVYSNEKIVFLTDIRMEKSFEWSRYGNHSSTIYRANDSNDYKMKPFE